MTYDINRLKTIHSEDLNYSTVIIKCSHSLLLYRFTLPPQAAFL